MFSRVFYFIFEGIRADPTTKEKMPKDGTVFQLTSNVILFLEQIMEYVDTLAMILTQDTSYNQTLLRLPRKISVSDRNPALVGLYIRKVLVQLNLTLVNKSDYYADQFLKAVFRLNNNQYILKGKELFFEIRDKWGVITQPEIISLRFQHNCAYFSFKALQRSGLLAIVSLAEPGKQTLNFRQL